MKNVKNQKKNLKVRKSGVLFILLFIGWTLLSWMFLSKTLGPAFKLMDLRDEHIYQQQHAYGPKAYEKKDKAYNEYNDYANELINSEDDVVAFYANQNSLVKVILTSTAIAPFVIIAIFVGSGIKEDIEEIKEKRARKAKRAKYYNKR